MESLFSLLGNVAKSNEALHGTWPVVRTIESAGGASRLDPWRLFARSRIPQLLWSVSEIFAPKTLDGGLDG